MAQVGVLSLCQFGSLDGLSYSNAGRNLKTWWNFEDFLEAAPLQSGLWTHNAAGAGAVLQGSPGENIRPGQVTGSSGTTAAGRAGIYASSYLANGILFGSGEYTFEADFLLPVLSTAIEEFTTTLGFGETTAADQVDGAYFYYDRALAGVNWRLKTANNSARTDTDSTIVVVAGAWTRFKIIVNAAGTLVSYYINNVLVGTNNANIPTGAGRQTAAIVNILKSVGITARSWTIDWAWLHIDLTTTR